MREYNHLDVTINGDVFRIAFDRPEQENAISEGVYEELTTVFSDVYDSDARVVLLTGNGDSFSSGGDLEWLQKSLEEEHSTESLYQAETIIRSMITLDRPIVVRLNGDAIGLGATLALFGDIVIADETARIGDPHVRAGLVAGDGGAVIWPLLMNMHKAKELLMTGELVSGDEAKELGLVNYSVPTEKLDKRVEAMIDKLASGSQPAIRYTKLSLNSWIERELSTILRTSYALEEITMHGSDHEEGVDAFLEGRRPNFPSGRHTEE